MVLTAPKPNVWPGNCGIDGTGLLSWASSRIPLEALAISDLFLLPSESESFGLAAHWRPWPAAFPVVATEAGGLAGGHPPRSERHAGPHWRRRENGRPRRVPAWPPSTMTKFKQQALKRAAAFDHRAGTPRVFADLRRGPCPSNPAD